MNPTPKSPLTVTANPDYELVRDYLPGNYYPSADEVIVKHKESDTYWKTVYRVREDDSDYSYPANWVEVVPEKVTIIKFNPK